MKTYNAVRWIVTALLLIAFIGLLVIGSESQDKHQRSIQKSAASIQKRCSKQQPEGCPKKKQDKPETDIIWEGAARDDTEVVILQNLIDAIKPGTCWKFTGTETDMVAKVIDCPPERSFSERVDKDLIMENYKRKLEEVAGRPHVHIWVTSQYDVIDDISCFHIPCVDKPPYLIHSLEICKADGMLRVPPEEK